MTTWKSRPPTQRIYANSPRWLASLLFISISLLGLLLPATATAGEDSAYRYQVTINHDTPLCGHMQSVFREYFRRPFHRLWTKRAYIKMGGRLPTHLQGVPDTNQTFQAIQYSLRPPAPDFNAVHWRLGVEVGRARGGGVMYSRPILMTRLDLFNNDHPVTIAKDSFMGCYVPGCYSGSEDNLQLLSKTLTQLQASPVDLFTIPRGPKHDLNAHKDNQGYPWCSNIRPFIYKKTTYVSCYHRDWITPPSLYHRAPEKEEMQIYRYFAETPRAANVPSFDRKMLCRFRMTAIH